MRAKSVKRVGENARVWASRVNGERERETGGWGRAQGSSHEIELNQYTVGFFKCVIENFVTATGDSIYIVFRDYFR